MENDKKIQQLEAQIAALPDTSSSADSRGEKKVLFHSEMPRVALRTGWRKYSGALEKLVCQEDAFPDDTKGDGETTDARKD